MRDSPRRRWIHRRGAVFTATLDPPADWPDRPRAPGAADHPRSALVRISNTFGWPQPFPDWTGMGLRVFEQGTDGAHHDLLLASAATEPDLWCRLRPDRDVLACSFTSGVRYPIGGLDQVVASVPIDDRSATLDQLLDGQAPCPLRYRVDVAANRGSWRGLGDLMLIEQHDDDRSLRFVPPGTGPRLFTTVRRAVYRLAQG